jgi:hypothetical protein
MDDVFVAVPTERCGAVVIDFFNYCHLVRLVFVVVVVVVVCRLILGRDEFSFALHSIGAQKAALT